MLQSIVLAFHVLVALLIISLVLLQRGKGAEAGSGFGAGASGTVFGARGSANFLSRTTAALATLFFVSCLTLVYLSTQQRPVESVVERETRAAERLPVPELPAVAVETGAAVGSAADRQSELPEVPVTGAGAAADATPDPTPGAVTGEAPVGPSN